MPILGMLGKSALAGAAANLGSDGVDTIQDRINARLAGVSDRLDRVQTRVDSRIKGVRDRLGVQSDTGANMYFDADGLIILGVSVAVIAGIIYFVRKS